MLKALNHRHFPFQAFTTTVILVLVFPAFFQHGMFMDGTQYAVVAQNLAEGKGTFWFPYLSASWEKQGHHSFLEHPPLVYWLQSWFFKWMNSSIYSERMYSLLTFLLSAQFIRMIWRFIFKQHEAKYFSWVPVLFWAIIPTVYWSYNNNMLENTVSVFVLASVYMSIRALHSKGYSAWWLVLSGLFIFLSGMSKGLPGLFPVCVFICYSMVFRKHSFAKMIAWSGLILLLPMALLFSLFQYVPGAKESLMFYLNERLLFRIQYTEQVESRWMVLWWLISDLVVPFILVAVFYFVSRKRKSTVIMEQHKSWGVFFLLLAFCGALPFILTHVQRAVYYAPALPFFALAMAFIALPFVWKWNERPDKRTIRFGFILSFTLLIGALFFLVTQAGKTSRDKNILDEVHLLGAKLQHETVIGVPYSIYDDWDFQFYLLRYHKITLNPYPGNYQYKMLEKEQIMEDDSYGELMQLRQYKLYKKRD
jgi:4-amino-4-deoxy-L-arabinose transferase-like glycosyltransferase